MKYVKLKEVKHIMDYLIILGLMEEDTYGCRFVGVVGCQLWATFLAGRFNIRDIIGV